TGASFFIISQTIGASFRLFLAAIVLQIAFFDAFGIPFWATVLITLLLIWLYTFKAGIKTIVWTDTLQTTFLIVAVLISIFMILQHLDLGVGDLYSTVAADPMSKIFEWDWLSDRNIFITFFDGFFITIAMIVLLHLMLKYNIHS